MIRLCGLPLFVLASLAPGIASGQDAAAFLDSIEIAAVNLPGTRDAGGYWPSEQRRVCFEPGAYVLAFYVPASGGVATIGLDDQGAAGQAASLAYAVIRTDDAQRWSWSLFRSPAGECHNLIVAGIAARVRVYRLTVGIAW